jgi:ribosomal protein S18 acetylase RimI-like enzyme
LGGSKVKEYIVNVRTAVESDYKLVIGVLVDWWDGRDLRSKVCEDLFHHFNNTCFIVEDENGELIGFLLGYLSQTFHKEAYISWIGVHPGHRNKGIARMLYERFYEIARKNGRTFVTSYTALVNIKSMQWHKHMGFSVKEDGDRYYFKKEI